VFVTLLFNVFATFNVGVYGVMQLTEKNDIVVIYYDMCFENPYLLHVCWRVGLAIHEIMMTGKPSFYVYCSTVFL